MSDALKELLLAHQRNMKLDKDKIMECKVLLKEIDTQIQANGEEKNTQLPPIAAALGEAQCLLDEARERAKELKIETTASSDRLIFWINSFIFLIFPGLVVKIFKLFDCTEILSVKYLTADLSVECYTGAHSDYVILGYFLVVFYVFGIPMYTFYALYKNRASLYDEAHPEFYSSQRRYSVLF